MDHLTTWLFAQRQVTIPGIGSISLERTPAALQFADRQVAPPHTQSFFSTQEGPLEEQIEFLAESLHTSKALALQQLSALGDRMQQHLSRHSLEWIGVGTLSYTNEGIRFAAAPPDSLLLPAPAHKVFHEVPSHTVRVGETEWGAIEAAEKAVQPQPRNSRAALVSWILIGLLVAALVFWFFQMGAKATGLRLPLNQIL